MLKFDLGKQFDDVYSNRINMGKYNEDNRKAGKLRNINFDKHHTGEYKKQQRFLNTVKMDLINKRGYTKQRVKINGNAKNRATITVDNVTYTVLNLPESVYEWIGCFGNPARDRNAASIPAAVDNQDSTPGAQCSTSADSGKPQGPNESTSA